MARVLFRNVHPYSKGSSFLWEIRKPFHALMICYWMLMWIIWLDSVILISEPSWFICGSQIDSSCWIPMSLWVRSALSFFCTKFVMTIHTPIWQSMCLVGIQGGSLIWDVPWQTIFVTRSITKLVEIQWPRGVQSWILPGSTKQFGIGFGNELSPKRSVVLLDILTLHGTFSYSFPLRIFASFRTLIVWHIKQVVPEMNPWQPLGLARILLTLRGAFIGR
jgi:hypothetical protein